MLRMNATSSSEKPSSDSSRNACRGSGVMFDSLRSGGSASVATSGLSLSETEFQIWVKQLEQPGARAMPFVEQRAILQQGLQHGTHIGIARGLVSGQRTGIAPQQRQMFSNEL